MVGGLCFDCNTVSAADLAEDQQRHAATENEARSQEDARAAAIILTTESAHDLPVAERLGIVAAECVIGLSIFRDLAAAARDVWGGRSGTMQSALKEARETVLGDLRREALTLGAEAVVAIDLDYSEISGGGKSMLFLVASGTAVRLARR